MEDATDKKVMKGSNVSAKELVEFYKSWNDAYHGIIYFTGAIGGAIIIFSLSFIFDIVKENGINPKIDICGIMIMFLGLGVILLSLICVFVNIFATYNWYIRTTLRIYSEVGANITEIAKDNKYSESTKKEDLPKYEKRSRLYGMVSYWTGWCGVILLAIGIALYIIAIWIIVSSVLN